MAQTMHTKPTRRLRLVDTLYLTACLLVLNICNLIMQLPIIFFPCCLALNGLTSIALHAQVCKGTHSSSQGDSQGNQDWLQRVVTGSNSILARADAVAVKHPRRATDLEGPVEAYQNGKCAAVPHTGCCLGWCCNHTFQLPNFACIAP